MQNLTNQNVQTLNTIPEIIPLSKFNDYFPYPTIGALRQYNFYGDKNGFNKVVVRIGKRVYIKISAFKEWIEEGTGEKASFTKK